ncbi:MULTISPECIES: rod-binding protein [unclassified Duganella]|uniref:rod-binding protein n=1 Tax=unclassified Duganella TaxID=2636909 RepID=UPI000E34E0A7|nr:MULTISPECIES: rod-binding protein [unclassified Duganella]RFP18969.1 hypothetical protein D0T23_04075 [Duganella sp. BJB475]RFP35631.1 hypothetical protein D0T21_04075 [Duganella sp. BJB476]
MNFDPSKFDGSTMRIGVADQLSETPVAAAPAVDDGVDPKYRAKATEAAVKFESFFIGHMLHHMRAGTRELASEDSVFKDKINEDMLDMADNLVADQLAGQRAFGVADAILRQLLPPASAPVAMQASLSRQAAAASSVAEPQNIPAVLNPAQ